jgi:hypothetical protein
LASVALLLAANAWADRPFPFTWTSPTQPKQTSAVEVWVTARSGRPVQYDLLEGRAWVGLGVARNADLHLGLEADATLRRREQKELDGRLVALARYRFLEPTEVVGLALIGRFGLGVASSVFEARVVIDRVVGDTVLALNSSFERTIDWQRREQIDTRLDHSIGIGLRIAPDLVAGFEGRARQGIKNGQYQGTAVYTGPTLTWRTTWFSVSLGLLAQIASHKVQGDRGNGESLIFRDDERFAIRIAFSLPTAQKPSADSILTSHQP